MITDTGHSPKRLTGFPQWSVFKKCKYTSSKKRLKETENYVEESKWKCKTGKMEPWKTKYKIKVLRKQVRGKNEKKMIKQL